jgi:hypothetical protein
LKLRQPGLLRLMLEWRAPWEFGLSLAGSPLLRRAPPGDGHTVMVFPGLGASDWSTQPMRRFLGRLGYDTHGWDQGMNCGPRTGVLEECLARLINLAEASAGKVSLIGWSLGGIYARELAKLRPDLVRTVQTLGTPFAGPPSATNAWSLYRLASGHHHPTPAELKALRRSPPVPTTSIYSRSDGVVAWQCSVQPHDETDGPSENIEIPASHLGIGFHPLSLLTLADRLGQPENQWQPFRARGLKRHLVHHYV